MRVWSGVRCRCDGHDPENERVAAERIGDGQRRDEQDARTRVSDPEPPRNAKMILVVVCFLEQR
jgi:hypothetical protein